MFCSWGRGEDGQLGHGDAEDRLLPTHLSALDGHEIVSVTCGADHTIAYSNSRSQVYSWGWFVLYLPSLRFCFQFVLFVFAPFLKLGIHHTLSSEDYNHKHNSNIL